MILVVLPMSLANATFINFFLRPALSATQNSFQSSGPMAHSRHSLHSGCAGTSTLSSEGRAPRSLP